MDEKKLLQVIAEQKEEITTRRDSWVSRSEEALFELDSSLAQVVIGVRRSGKSTLCHKVLQDHGINYAYANLDDDRLMSLSVEDLNTLLLCLYQLYGTDLQYILLDEIQNVDGWHLFVNRLLRQGLHVFVTGSNAKLLSSELATHLTGRYNEIRLYPLSFAEYCSFHQVNLQDVTTKAEAARKSAFLEYLQYGGFPELQSVNNKRAYIQSLLDSIILKDIAGRFKIRHAEVLRTIANHIINNSCQEVNYKSLAENFGLNSTTTAIKYVDYLKQAFLIGLLSKHSFKSKVRLRNSKAYVIDTGFITNRENALSQENLGWRLENMVYIELLRRVAKEFDDVYYYKHSSQSKEVDFVVCRQGKAKELVQVAYEIESTKTFNRETSALINASESLRCDSLTLVCFEESRDELVKGKTIRIRNALEWCIGSGNV
ncbi:MAG: ATP-binding protein [Fibrobacter sp.]|uniref:ATP-binding protein n=1 Tax=Fibrobacter sp. TaxID=35828 RepID=UPI0025BA5B29|nr:ATP-binding protein [Fibrobacter sp.]MBQ7078902.1 ATP-binding protein [Fibrobacter sp.]